MLDRLVREGRLTQHQRENELQKHLCALDELGFDPDGVLRRSMEMELESLVLLCDVRGLTRHLVVLSGLHGLHGARGLTVHLNCGSRLDQVDRLSTIWHVDLDGQVRLGVGIIVVDHNVDWGLFSISIVFLTSIASPVCTHL